jgi:uncharacterized protein (DUF1499 family)
VLAACGGSANVQPTLRSPVTGDLAACETRGCVCSQDRREGRFVEPLRYSGSPLAARDKLARVLGRMSVYGYSVVVNEGDYIHALQGTGRSVSDLEFVFSQSEQGVIHVRAAPRGGGDGRKLAEEVRTAYTVAKN